MQRKVVDKGDVYRDQNEFAKDCAGDLLLF